MTKLFKITNQVSGLTLGDYEGETAQDALDTMSRDAGYADYRQSLIVCGCDTEESQEMARADMIVTEVTIDA